MTPASDVDTHGIFFPSGSYAGSGKFAISSSFAGATFDRTLGSVYCTRTGIIAMVRGNKFTNPAAEKA